MTNGEKIKEIFPSTDSRLDERTGIMLVKWVDGATKCFKADWWNAEYKEPKNDLGVDECVSKQTVFNDDTGNFENVVYREDIEKAPPITPTRKKGKWIIKATGFPPEPMTVCSECGFDRDYYIFPRGCHKMKFCPNCGAKMESEDKK